MKARDRLRTESLVAALDDLAGRASHGIRLVEVEPDVLVPWSAIAERGFAMAATMRERMGIGPGDTVVFDGPPSPALFAAFGAAWIAGAAVQIARPETSTKPVGTEVRASGTGSCYFLDHPTLEQLWVESDDTPGEASRSRVSRGSGIALRQATSGTTGKPVPVTFGGAEVLKHVRLIRAALDLQEDSVVCSWLPLYHDMGLVAMAFLPMLCDIDLVAMQTASFVRQPGSWFAACASFDATFTAAPCFAYAVAAKAALKQPWLQLSRMSAMVNGGEPVQLRTVRLMERLEAAGVVPVGVHRPAYGLAEALLAVSVAPGGRPVLMEPAPSPQATPGQRDLNWFPEASFARLGPPLPGVGVRIESADRSPVGEIVVEHQRLECADDLSDRWRVEDVRTGDLGFLVDGEVVVCGRIKDVFIVGGRNVPAELVEEIAESVPGVRPGGAVAFGEWTAQRTERLTVVAELASGDASSVRARVEEAVLSAIGHRPKVVCVARGAIPKTSSGKRQRRRCRDALRRGELEDLRLPGRELTLPHERSTGDALRDGPD